MKTLTENEIEQVKKLCTRAIELCVRRSAFRKFGTKPSGQHTLDGVVVGIPVEELESIRNSNTALLDAELLGVLNRFVDYTDREDCKGKKNTNLESIEGSNETHGDGFFDGIEMLIYKALATLSLPVFVVQNSNDDREKIWIEVAKMCECCRSDFDIALEKVITDVMVHFRKTLIKDRFKNMKYTKLSLLTNADHYRELWEDLNGQYGTNRELFEKELIESLHEECGYSIEALNAMKFDNGESVQINKKGFVKEEKVLSEQERRQKQRPIGMYWFGYDSPKRKGVTEQEKLDEDMFRAGVVCVREVMDKLGYTRESIKDESSKEKLWEEVIGNHIAIQRDEFEKVCEFLKGGLENFEFSPELKRYRSSEFRKGIIQAYIDGQFLHPCGSTDIQLELWDRGASLSYSKFGGTFEQYIEDFECLQRERFGTKETK